MPRRVPGLPELAVTFVVQSNDTGLSAFGRAVVVAAGVNMYLSTVVIVAVQLGPMNPLYLELFSFGVKFTVYTPGGPAGACIPKGTLAL
jgi:hypothetical protein